MQVKLNLNEKDKIVIIRGVTKDLRDEYIDKLLDMEEVSDDETVSTREKMKKTKEFLSWVEDLSLQLSNLTDEEKEIIKKDIELSDPLRDALRELLQPISEAKKK